MTSDCGRFYDEDDDDKICTINSSGDKCEIKLCSEQTENCGNLIPYSYKKNAPWFRKINVR